MGVDDLRSKRLKAKAVEIALVIIKTETETGGIRADDLSRLVSNSVGSRILGISSGTMGQLLISHVSSGIIYRSRTVEGNTVYHYNLDLETEQHGMET